MLSFTDEVVDNLTSKPVFSDSEEELNLDLPIVRKKNISGNRYRILSDQEENDSESSAISNNDNLHINFSSGEESIGSRKKDRKKTSENSKTKQFLSTEWIVDSETDDGGADHDPSKPPPSSSPIVSRKKHSSKSKTVKSPKSEFKKASEDFKSTLKLMSYNSEEDEEEEVIEDDGNEADFDEEDNDKRSNRTTPAKNKAKKPKETLKNVLKESEALLRRVDPVELPVNVLKPKPLSLILSEALATNSRSPIEARKRVIEEKRKLQRTRMEKLLGSERLSRLSQDVPKIGQFKLDEAVEIDIQVFDEKAAEGTEDMIVEKVKVKLVDLPDKHFKGGSHNNTPSKRSGDVAGYKVHLQSHKKASIEALNRQLQEKIEAQGNAFMARQQRAREAEIAAKRAQAAKKEHLRRIKEAKREKELKERREKKVEGGELFASDKYKGVERLTGEMESVRMTVDEPDEDGVGVGVSKKMAKKIILSDDSEAELLNLGSSDSDSDSDSEVKAENEDENEGDSLSGLLSGKFDTESEDDKNDGETDASDESENESVESTNSDLPNVNFAMREVTDRHHIAESDVHKQNSNTRKQSVFIDDEASDEDEEREAEEIDEVALQEEMIRSKFIASDDEEEEGTEEDFELMKFVNEKRRREDEEITRRMVERYGKHIDEDSQDIDMFDALGNKYGLVNVRRGGSSSKKYNGDCEDEDEEDDELRKLLLEQKKRKIEALGPRTSNSHVKRMFSDDEQELEFKFKSSQRGGGPMTSSDNEFYAQDSSDDFSNLSDSENDYYEREESGLQSKVNEQVDPEEEQVQAAVDLDRRLATMNEVTNITRDHPVNNGKEQQNQRVGQVAALSVPKGDAKLKTRLLALQGENDENGNGSGGGERNNKVFKGFISSNKK